MKIKEMITQHRRDFTALMICEHCGEEEILTRGYDDANYHENVIPKMKCKKCDKVAPDDYQAKGTRYHDGETV